MSKYGYDPEHDRNCPCSNCQRYPGAWPAYGTRDVSPAPDRDDLPRGRPHLGRSDHRRDTECLGQVQIEREVGSHPGAGSVCEVLALRTRWCQGMYVYADVGEVLAYATPNETKGDVYRRYLALGDGPPADTCAPDGSIDHLVCGWFVRDGVFVKPSRLEHSHAFNP